MENEEEYAENVRDGKVGEGNSSTRPNFLIITRKVREKSSLFIYGYEKETITKKVSTGDRPCPGFTEMGRNSSTKYPSTEIAKRNNEPN